MEEKSIYPVSIVIKYWAVYCVAVDYDRGNGYIFTWENYGFFSIKLFP